MKLLPFCLLIIFCMKKLSQSYLKIIASMISNKANCALCGFNRSLAFIGTGNPAYLQS